MLQISRRTSVTCATHPHPPLDNIPIHKLNIVTSSYTENIANS